MKNKHEPLRLSEHQKLIRITAQHSATIKSFPNLHIFVNDKKLFIYKAGSTEPAFIFIRKNNEYVNPKFTGKAVRDCLHWAHRQIFGCGPAGMRPI